MSLRTTVTVNGQTYKCISYETVCDINIKPKGGCKGRLVLCNKLYEIFRVITGILGIIIFYSFISFFVRNTDHTH